MEEEIVMNKKNQMVSIIIPLYNAEKYIINMLKSIEAQTYRNYEIIIVNDGSTDTSEKLAEKYLMRTKIKYKIINKANGGQSSARNIGIDQAKGFWFVMLDADDEILPDYLESMINISNDLNSDIVVCDIAYIVEKQDIANNDIFIDDYSGKEAFKLFIKHKKTIGPCTMLIKKDVVDKINLRFIETCRYSEEFIFICDLLYKSEKVSFYSKKLYLYYMRPQSVITGASIEKILDGYNHILKYTKKYNKLDNDFKKYAMARWILATCRIVAKRISYKDYKILLKMLNAKKNAVKLIGFPDLLTNIAAITLFICPSLAYQLFKKI